MSFLIVGAIISIVLIAGTIITLMIYYNKKKEIFEKSKKADGDLKNIDFEKNADYFRKNNDK